MTMAPLYSRKISLIMGSGRPQGSHHRSGLKMPSHPGRPQESPILYTIGPLQGFSHNGTRATSRVAPTIYDWPSRGFLLTLHQLYSRITDMDTFSQHLLV